MPENPQNKLEKAAQNFETMQREVYHFKQAEKDTPLEPELFFKNVDIELENIHEELVKLEARKTELMSKKEPTTEEKQELEMLQKIGRDIRDLDKLVLDYKEYYDVNPLTVAKTGNIKLLIQEKEKYGGSIASIFKQLKYNSIQLRDGTEDFKSIEKLTFSDNDLNEISKNPRNIFLVLKYAKLNNQQQSLLYTNLLKGNFVDAREAIALCLSQLAIPETAKRTIIENLKKLAGTLEVIQQRWAKDGNIDTWVIEESKEPYKEEMRPYTDEGMAGIFLHEIDILANPNLKDTDKKEIMKFLIPLASGLDAEILIKKYGKFIDEKDMAALQEKIKKDPFKQNFEMPSMYNIDPTQLIGKKIKFIVHPLFSTNFEKGIDGVMSKSMNNNTYDPKASYTYAQYNIAQIETYKQYLNDPNSFVIFAFPREDEGSKSTGRNDLQFFNDMTKGHSNVAYMETNSNNSGALKQWDMKILDEMMPADADIEASGGYLNACLGSGIESIAGLKNKRRINVNYTISVVQGIYSSELKEPLIGLEEGKIKTYEDMLELFRKNPKLNDEIIKRAIDHSEKKYQEDQETTNLDYGYSDAFALYHGTK